MLPLILIIASSLAIVIGMVGIIVIGFETNPNLGCLLVLFAPIMCFVFFWMNPRRTAWPFGIMLAGYIILWGTLIYIGHTAPPY
jgi:hypothetical protein